ncbi:hypothetical protein JVT61DRAFT_4977 [Boletus reticuloceps]|uniref:Xylanolytic transcriptional activator regulatory domain-containing protein n=1 Tax=Boletus reticuloceps TaxID=495285 RepID=A0A8I3ACQ0_9AGAM|nr:hypothetical protein JVT61DRAFT_4977 [Boletus reticuloceps]
MGNNSHTSQSSAEKTSSDSTRVGASSASEPETDSFIDAFGTASLALSKYGMMTHSLGTLTIGTHGETSFMSSTARSEFLVGYPLWKAPTWATLVQNSRLPARVINASTLEHDVTPADNELREIVMGYRPPLAEAIRLCEIYLEWQKTLWTPLSRHELLDEITGSVYRADSYESIPGPHALSLLFSIFALASLFDLSRPAYSIEAYEYYILSRVALEFSSPCTTTTLQTVLALGNNIQWLDLSNIQVDPSWTYTLAGLGVKLAYRMGLHLHSARFRLEKSIAQKRSTVFWQMFLMDTMLSFYTGRPPNVSLDWIDAPYPDDEFPLENDKGEFEMSWRSWSWRFSKLLHEVLVRAFGAKIPAYSTILELDRKIRDFPIPSHLQLQCINDTRAGPQFVLQQALVLTMKESVLLNIHRRYFSQALQDSPTDPLKYRYGPSVMAMYRSAWRLIVNHTSAVNRIPDIAARLPILWSQALSAAIVMCMIVTRAPSSNMAASSLHEIDVVYEVFKKAAPTTKNASNLLEHITKVWHKGHENVYHPRSECIISRAELDRVGGGSTSLISKTSNAPSPSSCPSTASSPDCSTSHSNPTNVTKPPCVSNSLIDLSSSSIHPRIMQDMQSFDGFQASFTATGGTDYAPEQFSQSMIDTQFSHFVEVEASKAQEALNTFYPAQPQPLYPLQGVHSTEGMALDSDWESFMEQLGF